MAQPEREPKTKKVIIAVEMPDDINNVRNCILYYNDDKQCTSILPCEILPRPTDEEIFEYVEQSFRPLTEPKTESYFHAFSYAFTNGAKWIRSKYHKEDRE